MLGSGARTSSNLTRRPFLVSSLFYCLCVAGCGGGDFTIPDRRPAKPDVVSLDPQAWYIFCGQGVPEHPSPSNNGAWTLEIPNAAGSIQYVQTPFYATARPSFIRITFRLDASSGAVYNGRVIPDARDPATLRLFIQRRGDDLRKEYYRWWASGDAHVLGLNDNSLVTIEVPLSPEYWTSVNGQHNAGEFSATLNDIGYVGITFGGSNYFATGVNMRSGNAKLTLMDFQVR